VLQLVGDRLAERLELAEFRVGGIAGHLGGDLG
jgi:hypothetical protein